MSFSMRTKLAATLVELQRLRYLAGAADWFDPVDVMRMTPEQVIALFEFDHYPICKADGGSDHHSNCMPRGKPEHREKTAKVDIPQIAKGKRLRKTWEPHAKAIATGAKPPRRASKWPKRGLRSRRRRWQRLGV
jgi:hypothetical protein